MRCNIACYRGLFLLLTAFCGCSRTAEPPAEFARQISFADRIVVTNRYGATTFAITGEEVGRIGKAVASAKRDKNSYQAIFDWDVQFYADTNLLTVIRLQDAAFLAGGTQYSDDTGVLKAFYHRLEKETEKR